MALALEGKKAIVAEVADYARQSISGLAADYRGLTVEQLTRLRADARKQGVYVRVVRNTLARRALSDTGFACLEDVLTGPTILAFSKEEPGAAARLFKDHVKSCEHLNVKAMVIEGKMFGVDRLNYVAELPTRDEALAILMQVMKAPISKFVRTLAEPHGKLVRTIVAIRDKKQTAAA